METIKMINTYLQKVDLFKYENTADFFDLLKIYESEDKAHAHKLNKMVRSIVTRQIANRSLSIEERQEYYLLYKRALLFDAPDDLDAFILYIEFDREPTKKFYQPRRKKLRTVVQDLQDLADGKIIFLSISLPPRVGKTTLGIFFMVWQALRFPDKPNLLTGHSDKLTKGMHKELLSILQDPQYLTHDVFDYEIKKISTEDETIDINANRRFPTLTCRSVLGTLTGAVDIKGILYADDLIEDLEESLNPNRLDSKYDAYFNQCHDRKGDNVPELHIGTRWNVNDVIGRIKQYHFDDPRYRFRVIPALNENDESNFVYDYPEISFSTNYYREMRQEFENRGDMATWYAKYQGNPRVREGLVFDEDNMNFYNGILPPGDYDVYSFCDIAWGGGDALAMPFLYLNEYGDVYVPDIIYNKNGKDITIPIVVARMIEHKPNLTRFETNNGGYMYKEAVEEELKAMKIRLNIDGTLTKGGKNAKGAKHSQILAYAPDIRTWYFIHPKKQNAEYRNAFTELTSYTQNGNVPHDDVPDAMAKGAQMILEGSGSYEIGDRPF